MADIEFNIVSGVACDNPNGAYRANYYFMQGTDTKMVSVDMGLEDPRMMDLPTMFEEARSRAAHGRMLDLPLEKTVALSVLRVCMARRHKGAETDRRAGAIGERVGSFVIAASMDAVEELEPLNSRERNYSAHGIGIGRRRGFGGQLVANPLIHLAVTRPEKINAPVTHAVRAYAAPSKVRSGPYVALHARSSKPEFIESIVSPNDIKR